MTPINTINSVFVCTEIRTQKRERFIMSGSGQETAIALRKSVTRLTRIVLEGFEINGNFVPLDIRK
jgi:hypothetical protein